MASSSLAGQISASHHAQAMAAMLAMLGEQSELPGPEWEAILRQAPRHPFAPAVAAGVPGI